MHPPTDTPVISRIAVVGAGRLGCALSEALSAAFAVDGPLGRGADPSEADVDVVLLCVPDAEIAAAAAALTPRAGVFVGHCSGATRLDVLAPHDAFSLHPLMTVTPEGAAFAGAGAAIAGATPVAARVATTLALALGMEPVDDRRRGPRRLSRRRLDRFEFPGDAEDAAERLAATAGLDRRAARAARPGDRRELGAAGRARAPSPDRSPAATRRRSRASARPSRSAPPSCCRCSTRSCTQPARSRHTGVGAR